MSIVISFQGLTLLVAIIFVLPDLNDGLIITSVIAGDKKFKTISFDSNLIKPITFEDELLFPTQFRRHRTVRAPKFDFDFNIPIRLPLEDEYNYEKPEKPTFRDFFFEAFGPEYAKSSSHPSEAGYEKTPQIHSQVYKELEAPKKEITYADSNQNFQFALPDQPKRNGNRFSIQGTQPNKGPLRKQERLMARSDIKDTTKDSTQDSTMIAQDSKNYDSKASYEYQKYPEFVPGGYVNFKLSGPEGVPFMTYKDVDRENWAEQVKETDNSMPYPILNYQQLQNFYGGLGTFTNGLPNNNYVEESFLDLIKSGLFHFTDKLKIAKLF